MSAIEIITNELQTLGSTEKAAHLSRFFKTGKGQYGENDRFLGVTVPETRRVAKAHAGVDMPLLSFPHNRLLPCVLTLLCCSILSFLPMP